MKGNQLYAYVGPEEIMERVHEKYMGHQINRQKDIIQWMNHSHQKFIDDSVTVTFVISEHQELLINDRHSEHVMCAGGEKVFSAGEMTFILDKKTIYIHEISNQSTGYCPEPSSWKMVEQVLAKTDLDYPEYFTNAFEFRYCMSCENINLVKEAVYECAVCGIELDSSWNFDKKPNET